jgi:hypothetical protein
VNEDNPEQVLPSQVVEMNIVNKDHEVEYMIDSDSIVIVVGIGSDSGVDVEYVLSTMRTTGAQT